MRPSGALCIVWHRFSSPIRSRFALKTLIHHGPGNGLEAAAISQLIFAFLFSARQVKNEWMTGYSEIRVPVS